MLWPITPPTEPGWYWHAKNVEPDVVFIFESLEGAGLFIQVMGWKPPVKLDERFGRF